MTYFNPFKYLSYFIKKFINIFIHKFFYLILIIFFIIFILLCNFFTSKSAYIPDNSYGSSWGYSTQEIEFFNNLIETYNVDDFDSFYIHSWFSSNRNDMMYVISFYNKEINGDLVILYKNGSNFIENNASATSIKSTNNSPNSVHTIVFLPNSTTPYADYYTDSLNGDIRWTSDVLNQGEPYLYTNRTIYLDDLSSTWFPSTDVDLPPNVILPYIFTTTSSIENWSFDYFTIIGSTPIVTNNGIDLRCSYNNVYYMDITNYLNYDSTISDTWSISIPRNQFFNEIVFNSDINTISFELQIHGIDDYSLGQYTLNLTSQQIININNQNTSNQLQNIQSSINNDNISNYGNNFSSFSNNMTITDTTSIDTMFNMIYNAFTTQYGWNGSGQEPYELELTLPISNQTIKISPYTIYGRNWYTDNDNTAITIIKTLLNMFWWYIIGSFVIKDIRNTINKVAEGNIENASSDIKKEML